MERRTRKRAVQQDGEEIARHGSNSRRMKTETSGRVQVPQVRRQEDWSVNDVVLDNIFKKLEPKALKVVRQVCKKWRSNASIILSREATMTISDRKSLLEVVWYHRNEPESSEKFIEIKELRRDTRKRIIDPDLRPSELALLGASIAWLLPSWTLEKLKTLKVHYFTVDEGTLLLWNIGRDLPNLTSLSLLRPNFGPSMWKNSESYALRNLWKPGKLESLEFCIPLVWPRFSWGFIHQLPKLKDVKVCQYRKPISVCFGPDYLSKLNADFFQRLSEFPKELSASKTMNLKYSSSVPCDWLEWEWVPETEVLV